MWRVVYAEVTSDVKGLNIDLEVPERRRGQDPFYLPWRAVIHVSFERSLLDFHLLGFTELITPNSIRIRILPVAKVSGQVVWNWCIDLVWRK